MTAPSDDRRIAETRERLREALARSAVEAKFGLEGVAVIFGATIEATDQQRAVLAARANEARRVADVQIAGPLATFLADHEAALATERARTEEADANLIALAAMYGEACGELSRVHKVIRRVALSEIDDEYEAMVVECEATEARADRLEAEVARLKAALGCHILADAYRESFPDNEQDAAHNRKSETWWRLMSRCPVPTDDPLRDACKLAATQIPEVVAHVGRAVASALTNPPDTGDDHAGS
ncbi:hypothetical protein [uncultured Methylobacterium sp.]|uniref:hypothetical protein n=1 Tax=uncultured Methylobacterium sp. TaxID=157278 RepID=UPI0035CA1BEB